MLHGPDQLTVPPGGKIVVQLSPDLPQLSPGDRATFFTNGLAYGDELVVAEVGRLPADAGTARTEARAGLAAPVSAVDAAFAELAQDEVADHAAQCEAVVRGHVSALLAVTQDRPQGEHDPQWWTATLEVDLTARGDVGQKPARDRCRSRSCTPTAWTCAGVTGPNRKPAKGGCGCCTRRPPIGHGGRVTSWNTRSTCSPACNWISCKNVDCEAAMLRVVNMIPRSLSGESSQDSEPNLAVNPEDPQQLVATAFIRDPMNGPRAPVFVSMALL